jgi:RNA polymerase sigma factor (sigma-70 family)
MRSVDLALSPERFHELVEAIRPDLHRYCARMTGSVADGEDIVQDVLMRAHASIGELAQVSQLRAWLFRIAHNRATDLTRSYGRRMAEPLDAIEGRPEGRDPGVASDDRLLQGEIFCAAIHRFGELTPIQRSCVILKDVLDHSLEEIAELCELTVSAVQAALHRGRARLQRLMKGGGPEPIHSRHISPALARYAELFGAHDWEGVRAMLADDVRLDVLHRLQRTGREEVSSYFSNYAKLKSWRLAPGWLDGREVLGVLGSDLELRYFIEVRFEAHRVIGIRDYRHVAYIMRDAEFEPA